MIEACFYTILINSSGWIKVLGNNKRLNNTIMSFRDWWHNSVKAWEVAEFLTTSHNEIADNIKCDRCSEYVSYFVEHLEDTSQFKRNDQIKIYRRGKHYSIREGKNETCI